MNITKNSGKSTVWNRLWQKLKSWFSSQFKSFLLSKPVKCREIKIVKQSLIGHSFYFFQLQGHKICSPFTGSIVRIYNFATLHLIGKGGLQIILTIKFNRKLTSIYEAVYCLVKEGQKVKKNETVFLIVYKEQISCVGIMIPWQPRILKKIIKLPNLGSNFVTLFYHRNPSKSKRITNFGKYS
jgi:hypothetical protein